VAPVASHADAQPAGGSAREPRASCLREIERLRVLPALPGAPDFERSRAQVLARAKAEPVLFMRTPKHTSGETFEVEHYRAQLERSPAPAFALYGMYRHFWRRPEVARAVLLRQGYLYADSPGLALGLVERVRLRHLFREPELFIQRGSETWRVVKRGQVSGRTCCCSTGCGPAAASPGRRCTSHCGGWLRAPVLTGSASSA
jgi:hypothetical protein